jgi:hypothetical protein
MAQEATPARANEEETRGLVRVSLGVVSVWSFDPLQLVALALDRALQRR